MTNLTESVKANVITWLILIMAGGLFLGAQVNNQKAQRKVKVVDSTVVVIKKSVDTLKTGSDATFTVTKDNAATYNVYFESNVLKIQNKVGDNKNLRIGFYGI